MKPFFISIFSLLFNKFLKYPYCVILGVLLKLFKVKLKTCEQHLDFIGLQLIFLP